MRNRANKHRVSKETCLIFFKLFLVSDRVQTAYLKKIHKTQFQKKEKYTVTCIGQRGFKNNSAGFLNKSVQYINTVIMLVSQSHITLRKEIKRGNCSLPQPCTLRVVVSGPNLSIGFLLLL